MKSKKRYCIGLLSSVLIFGSFQNIARAADFDVSNLDTNALKYSATNLDSDKVTQANFLSDVASSSNIGVEYSGEVYKYTTAINGINSKRILSGGSTSSAFQAIRNTVDLFPYGKADVSGVIPYTPPIITLNGQNSVVVPIGTSYTELGATATDTRDGDMTSKIIINGTVDTSTEGTYPITYNITDSVGKTATEVTRNVKVVDIVTVHDDSTSQKVITAAIDQGMFVEVDVVDISQVKGVKLKVGSTYKDPNVAWTVQGNVIEMFGQSSNSDGYAYIQLLDGSQYKATIN